MNSQNTAIRNYLEAGNSLTPLEALHKFGCLRLSGRIFDLKEQGLPIRTEIIRDKDKRYARYSLC